MRADLLPDPAHVRAKVHAALYPQEYRWGGWVRVGVTKEGQHLATYRLTGEAAQEFLNAHRGLVDRG